ncbi:hypothetical protein ES705_20877 [subsurface metagenome]
MHRLIFKVWLIPLILPLLFGSKLTAQECIGSNSTFKSGEEITYVASYSWFIVWTDVGQVKLTINETEFNGKPSYQFTGIGKTFKNWDWIFKVRDTFETTVDKNTLRPLSSGRNIREGNYRQEDYYIYNFDDTVVYAKNKTNENPTTLDTLQITPCTFDIMSALLYARNIDFSSYTIGDTIPVTVILDKELYPIYIRYLGIEDYKVKHIGKFECIKFSVMLIEGDMFHEGENMTIWATNDKNRIVVYAESPILVGSVKVRLAQVNNNRYPFTSLKK